MRKEILTHKLAYFVLMIGLAVFCLAFMIVWPSRSLQRVIVLLMSIFYFLWGVFAHVKKNKIDQKIILEYFVISLIAGLLLFFLTL